MKKNNYKVFQRLCLIWALVFVVVISSSCQAKEKVYSAQFYELFDTVTQIRGYAKTEEEFREKAQAIYDDLERYHQMYDIYNHYDGVVNLFDLNEQASKAPVEVSQDIIDLLLFSKDFYSRTDGKVNIAMGTVLRIWHDARSFGQDNPEGAYLPEMSELQEANKHVDIEKLVIDDENNTVFYEDPDMKLDVGATAKGYATERIVELAVARGEEHMLLSVGGNVRAIGSRKDDSGWSIGIDNPIHGDREEKPYVTVVEINNQSVVSSGLYERFFRYEGKIYHHIIDPIELMPIERYLSVSIITEHSDIADALSTALYNLPIEDGKKLIESFENTEAIWVMMDETLERSSGFSKLEKDDTD